MTDPVDYWIGRVVARGDRIFKKWSRLNDLHRDAFDRWGPDDPRTQKIRWRIAKFDVRDQSFSDAEQALYNAVFDDPKLKRFGRVLKHYVFEPNAGLRASRRLYGLTSPRKLR